MTGSLSWLSQLLDIGSGHDLTVRGIEPRVGLRADSAEPAWDSLSVCLSLSLKNKDINIF